VVVTNVYAAITSQVATLDFLWPPTIDQQAQDQIVAAGENVTFTVTVTNNASLPIGYQWRKSTVILTNIVLNARTCSFTMDSVRTNVTINSGPGSYRVLVTNAATYPSAVFGNFAVLTVVPLTAPSAVTLAPSDITSTNATLNGVANPNLATTTAWFDYGLTTNYGSRTVLTNIGNGSNAVAVILASDALASGTNYHYRLVATNNGGMAWGTDLVFQTIPLLPPSPVIGSFAVLTNGQFRLRFTGQSNTSYSVLTSKDLVVWEVAGPAIETAPGQFEFGDADVLHHETRFYRLRSP